MRGCSGAGASAVLTQLPRRRPRPRRAIALRLGALPPRLYHRQRIGDLFGQGNHGVGVAFGGYRRHRPASASQRRLASRRRQARQGSSSGAPVEEQDARRIENRAPRNAARHPPLATRDPAFKPFPLLSFRAGTRLYGSRLGVERSCSRTRKRDLANLKTYPSFGLGTK